MAKNKKAKKGGFMSLFFEEDDKPKKKATPKPESEEEVQEEVVEDVEVDTPAPTQETAPTQAVGQVNQGIMDDLMKTIEENDLEGYDYLEFRGAISNMAKVVAVESERFKAAFAAVASLVSVDTLVQTAKHYVSVVTAKQEEFAQVVQAMLADKVEGSKAQAETLGQQIDEKQQQIVALNEEISQMRAQQQELLNASINEKASIDKTALDFSTTSNGIIRQIEGDIEKIKKYLAPKQEVKEEEAANG